MTAEPDPGHSPEVTIRDRAHEAHRMHLASSDWPDIAEALGYSSAKTAEMAVIAYLQRAGLERGVEERRLALQLELDRLDALQLGLWDRAVAGDVKAAALVLRLIERRVALLGLDRMEITRPAPSCLVLDS